MYSAPVVRSSVARVVCAPGRVSAAYGAARFTAVTVKAISVTTTDSSEEGKRRQGRAADTAVGGTRAALATAALESRKQSVRACMFAG